jgi:tetratricopeptide (TPR) repeat protein
MAVPGKGDVLSGRYEILELLGHGGMGHVFRAADRLSDAEVAVKVLAADPNDAPQLLRRFEREVQTLQRLAHRFILRYLDHGREGDVVYMVTELLEGGSLDRLKSHFTGRPAEVLALGRRLASAFAEAHRLGIVHRDIKPGNIWLTSSGEPRILDYGLARWVLPADRNAETCATVDAPLTQFPALLGTVLYMSPEQLRAEPVDRRTDVFSLGVVLFELATGRRPYPEADRDSLLEAIESGAPPSLGHLRPELDTDTGRALDVVLGKALAAQRAARFQTMDELTEAIERAASLAGAFPGDASLALLLPPDTTIDDRDRGGLHGREAELGLLVGCLEEAGRGRGGAVVLSGPAGIGRSRLATEVVRIAHRQGVLCLTGHVRVTPSGLGREPFHGWLSRAAAVFPHDSELRRVREGVELGGGTPAVSAPDRDEWPDRLLGVLSRLAERGPLLLVLEDLHEAGSSVVQLLARLVTWTARRPVLLLLTVRDEAPLDATLPDLLARPELRRIGLGPLSADALHHMVAEIYAGLSLDDRVRDELHRRSGGNPTFARGILRLLEKRGELRQERGDWLLDGAIALPSSPEAGAWLMERLEGVDPRVVRVLHAAAVLGAEFDAGRLAETLELKPEDAQQALGELCDRHRLILRERASYRFDQPLTQQLLLERIGAAEREALHLRAAQSLAARLGSHLGAEDAAGVAHHYLEAGRQSDALPYCVRAGTLLRGAGAPEPAILWLRRARTILEQEVETAEIARRGELRSELAAVALALGECLDGVGRHGEAIDVLRKTRALALAAGLEDAEVRSMISLAYAQLSRGEVLQAQRQARDATRLARRRNLDLELARSLGVEAHALSRADEIEDAEERWTEAAELFERLGRREDAAETYFRLGSHYFRMDRFAEADVQYEKAASLLPANVDPRLYARIQNARGGVLLARGDPSRALPLFREALATRRRIGSRRGTGTSLHNIAFCHHFLGERVEACRIFEEVIALRREIGEEGRVAESRQTMAEALLALGRIEEALAHATEALATKRRFEERSLVPPALMVLGDVELELGRTERAREAFAEVIRDFSGHGREAFLAQIGMIQVERLSGRLAEAAAHLDRLLAERGAGAAVADLLRALHEAVRLCDAGARPAEWLGQACQPVIVLSENGLPVDPAIRLLLLRAALARSEGHPNEAKALIERALAASEGVGAIEQVWRIRVSLGEIEEDGTPERRDQLARAWQIVEAQAHRFRDAELRAAYLAHAERSALRRSLDGAAGGTTASGR